MEGNWKATAVSAELVMLANFVKQVNRKAFRCKLVTYLQYLGSEHSGGPWSPDVHQTQIWFDQNLVPSILRAFSTPPKSVLDIGCGLGLYLKDLHSKGVDRCVGVEPANMAISTISPFHTGDCILLQINAFDNEHPDRPDVSLGENFDLVISVEVAEHIPQKLHEKYFKFITSHGKDVIVFSGGSPGQSGTGHISLRYPEEWIEEFEKRGWHCDVNATEDLRTSVGPTFWWFERNIMLFRKNYTYTEKSFLKLVQQSIPYLYDGYPQLANLTFPTFSAPVFSSPMFAPLKKMLSSEQVLSLKKKFEEKKQALLEAEKPMDDKVNKSVDKTPEVKATLQGSR